MRWLAAALGLALGLGAGALPAATCTDREFDGATFTTCEVIAGKDALGLFWADAAGKPFAGFGALAAHVKAGGRQLVLAMNAGMFHRDLSPVGLYIEGGQELAPLVTRDGPGNFGLLPNGVFCIQEGGFSIRESRRFAADRPDCRDATQSGPLLVIDGALHPRFLPGSDSLHYRNGVGVSPSGDRAFLVISDDKVNFHHFARFFRDALGLRDALYLDGSVSRLFAPAIDRNDLGWAIGPMLAVTAKGGE